MSSDDKYDKKNNPFTEREEDESGDEGSGGQGSGIAFVDFNDSHAERRDDQLSGDEQKHLLIMHKEVHEDKVKHQKEKIELNKQLKNGKDARSSYGVGAPGGGSSDWQYKENPALANFGKGVDIKVSSLPNENVAETNQAQRDELQNELKLRLGQQPKFNPKPAGPY